MSRQNKRSTLTGLDTVGGSKRLGTYGKIYLKNAEHSFNPEHGKTEAEDPSRMRLSGSESDGQLEDFTFKYPFPPTTPHKKNGKR